MQNSKSQHAKFIFACKHILSVDRLNNYLFQSINNSQLIVFRIFFGLLLFLETAGAIITGWVDKTLIEPQITFPFFGLDFIQPLPGQGMYFYFGVMAVLGVFVMIGWNYRMCIIAFTLMWTGVYLMQKSSYNNHYYLLILLGILMSLVPANASHSFDARKKGIQSSVCPRWCILVFVGLIGIVYTYGSIAKMHHDWIHGVSVRALLAVRSNTPLISGLFDKDWFIFFVSYTAILFDLFITPLLLWKKTRKWAFVASLGFHLFNSLVFQIGIFPYLSIAFALFFFPPETIGRILLRQQHKTLKSPFTFTIRKWVLPFFIAFFIIQLVLPIRHHFIRGDVLWTEEGHRHSWRMMLRTRSAQLILRCKSKSQDKEWNAPTSSDLTPRQRSRIAARPDMLYTYIQFLKEKYKKEGINDLEVYAILSKLSVNSKPSRTLIDPNTDLASVNWNYFGHNEWITCYSDTN